MGARIFYSLAGPRLSGILLLGGLLWGSPGVACGQEFGPYFTRSHSDHPELPDPRGFGAYASVPLFDWLRARVSVDRISQSFRREGQVCTRYAPNIACRLEEVNTESALSTLRVSILPTLGLGEILQVGAGGGVSFSQVSSRSLGVSSGRKANLEAPKTGQLGYLAVLSVALTPSPRIPLTLMGSTSGHWVGFKHCVSYDEIYDPFCGTTLFQDYSLGLAVHF